MAGSDEGAQSGSRALAMTPAQSRAARGLLGWSEADLAGKVGLDERFVRDFEGGYSDAPSGQVEALRSALGAAGAASCDVLCSCRGCFCASARPAMPLMISGVLIQSDTASGS
ncbi:hypothetical protein OMR07_20615, partial [Methylobacterium organophilum]|nr:hypothetical protein [Methylobacterium organophilum]